MNRAVLTCREVLSFDLYIRAEFDGRVLVGAGSPGGGLTGAKAQVGVAGRYEFSPDLSFLPLTPGRSYVNGDIGESDPFRYGGFFISPPGVVVNWACAGIIVASWRVASRMPTVKTLLIWSSFKINILSFGRCLQAFKPKAHKPTELPDLPDAWYFMGAEMVINKEKLIRFFEKGLLFLRVTFLSKRHTL